MVVSWSGRIGLGPLVWITTVSGSIAFTSLIEAM